MEHSKICPKEIVNCENKCNVDDLTRDMHTNHLLNDCKKRLVKCSFYDYGCKKN